MNIKQIIEEHSLWLATNGKEGSCANFTGANLVGANFTDANLAGANFIGANPVAANFTDANLLEQTLSSKSCWSKPYRCKSYWADFVEQILSGQLWRANLKMQIWVIHGNLTRLKSIFCDTYHVLTLMEYANWLPETQV